MAVIVGDIHGDLAMAQAFLAYKPEAEHVALGDFVDSRDPQTTFADELACLDLLIESSATLIWGNHDLAYTPERPRGGDTHFANIPDLEVPQWTEGNPYLTRVFDTNGGLYCRDIFESRYAVARERGQIKAAHAVDGWLCTHAGVSTALTAALTDCPWDAGNIDPSAHAIAVASWLCEEFLREFRVKKHPWRETIQPYGQGPLFNVAQMRGGCDKFGGIFWYDPRWEPAYPPDPRVRQIFGHTLTEGPMRKPTWINIHIEGPGYWLFDTEVDDFVVVK